MTSDELHAMELTARLSTKALLRGHLKGACAEVRRLQSLLSEREAYIGTLESVQEGHSEQLAENRIALHRVYMELTGKPEVDPNDSDAEGWSPALREAGAATRSLEVLQARTLDALQEEVADWGEATFPGATAESIFCHLKREVAELAEAITRSQADNEGVDGELADCLMLLIHLARRYRVSLYDATRAKFEVNKTRQWGAPDAEGVVEHVREEVSGG